MSILCAFDSFSLFFDRFFYIMVPQTSDQEFLLINKKMTFEKKHLTNGLNLYRLSSCYVFPDINSFENQCFQIF